MADLSAYVDFKVTLDKSTDPYKIIITDNGSYPSELVPDITARFDIMQPDGLVLSTTGNTPDVQFNSGILQPGSKELRPASDGTFQRGLYVVTYRLAAPGFSDTEKTKSFYVNFKPPKAEISPSLDVFTPALKVNDITKYLLSGFTLKSVDRSWRSVLQNLGVTEGHDDIFDLSLNGEYYDAAYSVTLNALVSYYLNASPWVTVKDKISTQASFTTEVPMSLEALLTEINAYETKLGNCYLADQSIKNNYVLATSLFQNMLLRGRTGNAKIPLTKTIDNIQRVLNSGTDPIYEFTNEVIKPYDFNRFGIDASVPEKTSVFEIFIGTGSNYRVSADRKQLTPLNKTGKPALVNAKVDSMFIEGIKVPFQPRTESVWAYFNSVNGTFTLSNGTFADQAFISINTNANIDTVNDNISYGPFDTVFTFSGSATNSAYGFRFELPSLSNKIKFKFDKRVVRSGLGGTLRIKRGGATVGLGNFALDYLGDPFVFQDEFGIEHNRVVVDGTVSI